MSASPTSPLALGMLSFALATAAIPAAAAPLNVSLALAPQAGAGKQWNGTATFAAGTTANSVVATISFPDMMSIPEAAYPAAIRPGTCAEPTPGKRYTLTPVSNSRSTTTLHVKLDAIVAKAFSVEVRSDDGTRVLACGSFKP
jgi:hypothetical protein